MRIDETKQLGQGAVQAQDVVLALEAGWPENMPDIVGRGKTDGELVRRRVAA